MQLEASEPFMFPKLVDEGELVAAACAVEHRELTIRQGPNRMLDHGAKRRDAGAPRHEQQPRLLHRVREREGAHRPLEVNQGARMCPCELGAGVGLCRNEQLQLAGRDDLFWRAGD